MSETQYKVTGNFQAVDDEGNKHDITEYTLFRHTTTADMAENTDGDRVNYKAGNGAPVRRISEDEFEIESSGARLRRLP